MTDANPATNDNVEKHLPTLPRLPSMRIATTLLLLTLAACGPATDGRLPEQVDYNFHVKPILSDRCYKCHGPDDNARKAELRLNTREGALAASSEDSTRFIIVPGNPQASELIRHITSTNPKVQMPPPESNLALSDPQIALDRKSVV